MRAEIANWLEASGLVRDYQSDPIFYKIVCVCAQPDAGVEDTKTLIIKAYVDLERERRSQMETELRSRFMAGTKTIKAGETP